MTHEVSSELVRVVATAADAGKRLDKVLSASGAIGSRARVQALLRAGRVCVGGVPRKASYAVRAGEVVEARIPAAHELVDVSAAPEAEPLPLDVLYEDADLLAVNKAPGIVVHPAPGHWHGTLVNALVHHIGGSPTGGAPGRPGIVHRLDKDTSGVLLVAKTAAGHERLAIQFKERTVRKEYVAVVRGRMPACEGIIDRPIGRHPRMRQRMSVRTRHGRESVTRYVVKDDYGLASVVRLVPTTGRTHQLRVHLAAIGHPIIGDSVYGRARARHGAAAGSVAAVLARFPRQALHAVSLEFSHPRTGERLRVRAPLPPDLQGLLAILRTQYGAAA